MNCDRVRLLIDAYTTDELDPSAALDVEDHFKACPACAGELDAVRTLRRTVAESAPKYAAPEALRRRLSIPAASEAGAAEPRHLPRTKWPRVALAAAVGVLLLLPWLGLYWNASRAGAGRLAAEVTASHIRSLMSDHLLDVPSTDRHTVKPWFNGKLDFSPNVVDLGADGFVLVGGRLDYVDGRPVAAIVYRRRQHVINLFTWPAAGPDRPPSLSQSKGYNVVTWTRDGMSSYAVSDLNREELQQFVELFRPKPATRP